MKIFYTLMMLFQLIPAFVSRDQNRLAYLTYLWANYISNASPSNIRKKTFVMESEGTNNEYSLLLER